MQATATEPTAWTATASTTRTPTEPTAPTSLHALDHLGALVGAQALPAFLEHSLGQAPYRRRLPDGMARSLFDWDRLNATLAEHRLGPPRLKLEKDGADAGKGVFRERRSGRNQLLHDIDTALLHERLQGGATLILDAVNELSPPLQQLCAGLAAEFAAASQANLYACWGTSQGFDIHWDDHDVFVVQVEGAKRWRLYGSTRPSPLRRDSVQDAAPTEPLEEFLLEPGEMLYLPRGYWHAAVGVGGATMHLTIGLTRKTGHDLLSWLADRALDKAVVRADLPLEQGDAALGKRLAEVLAAAVAGEDPEALARAYRRHVEASRTHRPQLSLPYLGAGEGLDPDALLRLTDGTARLRPAEAADAIVFSHRGVDYTLAGELRAAMAPLVLGKAVRYGDFAAAAAPASAALVAGFVGEMIVRGVFIARPG